MQGQGAHWYGGLPGSDRRWSAAQAARALLGQGKVRVTLRTAHRAQLLPSCMGHTGLGPSPVLSGEPPPVSRGEAHPGRCWAPGTR